MTKTLYWLVLIPAALLTASCSHRPLTAYTDYITQENLASYYVDTPDPLLNRPPFGQRLIVTWAFPKHYINDPTIRLILTVRYRNRQQETIRIPFTQTKSTYTLCLLNEDYCEKGGILTYKVTLSTEDCILHEWKHQLWAEWIEFEETPPQEENFDFIPSAIPVKKFI